MSGRIASEIGQQAPINSIALELFLNVRRTADVLDDWMDRILAPAELKVEEFNILRILRGAGDAGHKRDEVERRMVSGTATFTASLHRLKSRGLIDGVFELKITPAGLQLLKRVDDVVAGGIRDLGNTIEDARMRTAIEVLEKLRDRALATR